MDDMTFDEDLDRRLLNAGKAFREAHIRSATASGVSRRPALHRRTFLAPLGAAAATAVLVGLIAVVIPSDGSSKPPTPSAASYALHIQSVSDLELGDQVIAMAYGGLGNADPGGAQVRRRDNLDKVVFRTETSYPAGRLDCLHLDGDWMLWTDVESIRSTRIPGPPTRHSLWIRNLRTGEQRKLVESRSSLPMGPIPCAVGSGGTAAWHPDPRHLTLLDLATGTTTTSPVDGIVQAVLPTGVLLSQFSGDAMQIVLRTGQTERVVRTVPRGIELAGAGDRLLWFEREAASETQDAGIVRTCTLPACGDPRLLARNPVSSWGVVGSTFAAWSDLRGEPAVRLFSGEAPPTLSPGAVSFRAMAARGNTLAYVTTVDDSTPLERATLHFVTIN